jgi:hypothetical protein
MERPLPLPGGAVQIRRWCRRRGKQAFQPIGELALIRDIEAIQA